MSPPVRLGLPPAPRIVLASVDDFRLGRLEVRPSSLVAAAGPEAVAIEHRAMQVLAALAGREGKVVSRGELLDLCWDGRLVGDDAINGCIAKVRRVAYLTGEPAFTVDTIPRVGYRLRAATDDGAPAPVATVDRSQPAAPLRMDDPADLGPAPGTLSSAVRDFAKAVPLPVLFGAAALATLLMAIEISKLARRSRTSHGPPADEAGH